METEVGVMQAKACGGRGQAGKGQAKLRGSRRNRPADILILARETHFRLLTFKTVRE